MKRSVDDDFARLAATDYADYDQRQHEEICTRLLIERFFDGEDAKQVKREIYRLVRNRVGEDRLMLEGWAERFPDFPVLIVASRIRYVRRHLTLGNLLCHSPRQQTLWRTYWRIMHDSLDEAGGRPVAMAIPFDDQLRKEGGLCIHNATVNVDRPGWRCSLILTHGKGVTLESYASMLSDLDWSQPSQ